jgi:outer membrane lipopolysaccharide assembly protein LptE/RlpB
MGKPAEQVLSKLAHGYAENFMVAVDTAKDRMKKIIVQTMVREQSAQIIRRISW